MDTTNCPYCKEPLNGIVCNNCGKDSTKADLVNCYSCNEAVDRAEAEWNYVEDINKGVMGNKHFCPDCV